MFGMRAFVLLLLCLTGPASARDGVMTPRSEPSSLEPPSSEPLSLLDLGAPSFINFSPRDGLPHAVTVSIRTDRDGFVWAASPVGVFRYDGRRWVASDDPAMAHAVDSLYVDHQGMLWAAFRSHGLARYDGTRWHVENAGTGLPSQQIRRFAETVDASGAVTLWALTWDQGLMFRRDGRWLADPGNASLPRGPILAMAQTRRLGGQLRQWVGTGSQGLWYRDAGNRDWQQWHLQSVDSAQVEYLLATDRGGREVLWISVFDVGLLRLSDDGLRWWTKESGELPTNILYDIALAPLPDDDYAIWISSRSGLIRVHDAQVQVFSRQHGLPSNVVRGLNAWRSPNGNNVIWLATESGVSRTVLGASSWSTASLMGANSIGVFGVLVEPDGEGGERLWVGASEDGVGLYAHGRWQYFTAANGALPAPSVSMIDTTMRSDGTRTRWVGLRGGELLRIRLRDDMPPVFERQDTPWSKTTGEAVLDTLTRVFDGNQERWVATRQSGAWRWRDGRWKATRPAAATGLWRVTQLQEQIDAAGRSWLWATTNQGLARFDGVHWQLFDRQDGLPDADLLGLSLIEDADGHPILWIGTSSTGVVRMDVGDPRHPVMLPDTLPPPPNAFTYGALRDSRGRIYICTNNGLQQLVPTTDGWHSTVFTRQDGMLNDECNTNAQFIDAHDRFWTGTLGGLTVYDPRRWNVDTQPKPLRITGMRIDGKPVSGPALHVAADNRSIRVEFALLSWYREDESRFRTRLIGFEDAPGDWTAQASRSFNALPPGGYLLRVEARDHAGKASIPVDIPITVAAQWWQRPWAYAVAVLALILLGYAGAQLRNRRLRAQRRILEQRVAARTAELDQANARLLELSYRDALTGLANRRRLLERLEQPDAAAAPTRSTALILVDVDHFKAYNDRFGHPAGDEALRRVAATMLRCAPNDALVARYGGEEFACLLPDVDIAQAITLAERMRSAVEACEIPVPGEDRTMRVTISAGVASTVLAGPDNTHRLLRDADMALYQAKHDGRNRVRSRAQTSQAAIPEQHT